MAACATLKFYMAWITFYAHLYRFLQKSVYLIKIRLINANTEINWKTSIDIVKQHNWQHDLRVRLCRMKSWEYEKLLILFWYFDDEYIITNMITDGFVACQTWWRIKRTIVIDITIKCLYVIVFNVILSEIE